MHFLTELAQKILNKPSYYVRQKSSGRPTTIYRQILYFMTYNVHVVINLSPFPSQAPQSIVTLGCQYDPLLNLRVTSHCIPISFFHYLQVLFNLTSPSIFVVLPFSYSFHSGSHYFLEILLLFILSVHPYHLTLSSCDKLVDCKMICEPFKMKYVVCKFYTFLIIIIISIQPEGQVWQEPEPSQATGMALAHCFLGSFLGVGCHCFPPLSDIPTFACRCLHVQAT